MRQAVHVHGGVGGERLAEAEPPGSAPEVSRAELLERALGAAVVVAARARAHRPRARSDRDPAASRPADPGSPRARRAWRRRAAWRAPRRRSSGSRRTRGSSRASDHTVEGFPRKARVRVGPQRVQRAGRPRAPAARGVLPAPRGRLGAVCERRGRVLRADGRIVDLEARERLRLERERRSRRRGRRGARAAAQRHQRDRALARRVEAEQSLDGRVREPEHELAARAPPKPPPRAGSRAASRRPRSSAGRRAPGTSRRCASTSRRSRSPAARGRSRDSLPTRRAAHGDGRPPAAAAGRNRADRSDRRRPRVRELARDEVEIDVIAAPRCSGRRGTRSLRPGSACAS